jgi:hypothetical protein
MVNIMSKSYYTYAYLREDRTPYYIGRGKGNRAFSKNHTVPPPPRKRILFLKTGLTFAESVDHERYMIAVLGRKDLGTGILRNLTDGGEGVQGFIQTLEARQKISKTKKNVPLSDRHRSQLSRSHEGVPLSSQHRARIAESLQGENHPRWKLTEDQRREIAFRYIPRSSEGNGNSAELALEYETTATSIRRIAKDPRWTS